MSSVDSAPYERRSSKPVLQSQLDSLSISWFPWQDQSCVIGPLFRLPGYQKVEQRHSADDIGWVGGYRRCFNEFGLHR